MSIKAIAWALTTVGVALLGLAAFIAVRRARQLGGWPRVDAQVSRVEIVPIAPARLGVADDGYGLRASARYSYEGKSYERTLEPRVWITPYASVARAANRLRKVGLHSLAINSADPTDVVLDEAPRSERYFAPIFLGAFGGGALLFGLICFLIERAETVGAVQVFSRGAIGTSVALLIMTIVMLAHFIARHRWPTVDARVQRTDLVHRETSEGDGADRHDYDEYAMRTWISYRFDDADTESVTIGNYDHDADFANERAARPAGTIVRVHVNPENPSEAIEQPPSYAFALIPFGIGVVFGALGIITRPRRRASSVAGGVA